LTSADTSVTAIASASLGTESSVVTQELVVNAIQHADPKAIDVLVSAGTNSLVLEVNDGGVGSDAAQPGRAVPRDTSASR
jgi:signal transduction histidine kinase